MEILEAASHVFLFAGAAFFFAGTIALLRFPDVYTRLHALAKADNLGLGFILLGLAGLALRAGEPGIALKLLLIWILVLAASATVSFLIARRALRHGIAYWRHEDRKEERKKEAT